MRSPAQKCLAQVLDEVETWAKELDLEECETPEGRATLAALMLATVKSYRPITYEESNPQG